ASDDASGSAKRRCRAGNAAIPTTARTAMMVRIGRRVAARTQPRKKPADREGRGWVDFDFLDLRPGRFSFRRPPVVRAAALWKPARQCRLLLMLQYPSWSGTEFRPRPDPAGRS